MEESQLLMEGLGLMTFGMGFVFVFLTLLVIATALMSRMVMRFVPVSAKVERIQHLTVRASADDEIVAVMGAAVHRYRQRHRR